MTLTFNNISPNYDIQEISNFILDSCNAAQNADDNTVIAARRIAPKLVPWIKPQYKDELFGLFNSANFNGTVESEIKYLNSFIVYLRMFIDNPEKITAEAQFDGLNRIAAPPKEAYISTGNNKMDIKETRKGYAMLLD